MDNLPDSCQVMVIVLRNKIQMIYEPHGLLQTRMQFGVGEEDWLQFLYMIQQTETGCAELRQNACQLAGVVVGVMSPAIAQVGDGEGVSISQKIIHARRPQGLEIKQMPSVLLSCPFVPRFTDQDVPRYCSQYLFQPYGSAAQANGKIWVLLHGERKVEFPFKPDWDLAHHMFPKPFFTLA